VLVAQVCVCDTSAEALRGVEVVEMDVRDDASVQLGIQSIIVLTKRIDVLVNNSDKRSAHLRSLALPRRLQPCSIIFANARQLDLDGLLGLVAIGAVELHAWNYAWLIGRKGGTRSRRLKLPHTLPNRDRGQE
jgi:NAD(P)-dependent dehydrogenase (short-subunit alcohol dehydrogenase family)